MRRRIGALCVVLLPGSLSSAHAQQASAEGLVSGVPGADLTKAKCTLCHEEGHILRSKLTPAEWSDTIQLMISRGAPITTEEQKIIFDYLNKHYGRPVN